MDELYEKAKIITPINALPSWEGYEYQGHCALNVALYNYLYIEYI